MGNIDRMFISRAVNNRNMDEFKEELHPRAENGQFTTGSGSNTGNKESQIAELKAQMSKLSMFGEGAKKRAEIRAKIKELQGTPEQKPQRQTAPTPKKPDATERGFPVTEYKQKQFEVIQATNPMLDDYHVGIRKPSDIRSPEEAFGAQAKEDYVYPDFTPEDGARALKSGRIKIYSSKPIKNGGFVSPSKRMAGDYAGGGKVYEKEVPINSVAWINAGEGQFAEV